MKTSTAFFSAIILQLASLCIAIRTISKNAPPAMPFIPGLSVSSKETPPKESTLKGPDLQTRNTHFSQQATLLSGMGIDASRAADDTISGQDAAVGGLEHGATVALSEREGTDVPAGPSKEKEDKAREKGEFVSDQATTASETFAEASMQDGGIGADAELQDFKKNIIKNMINTGTSEHITMEDLENVRALAAPEPFTKECVRDYSGQCPETFVAISTECHATKAYTGPCARLQKAISKFDAAQKESWGKVCAATWPCMASKCKGGVDYNSCPVGWTLGKGFMCTAPTDYDVCGAHLSLKNLSKYQKASLSQKCGFRFPCKPSACERDFTQLCPEKWNSLESFICQAPESYRGPCPRYANMTNFIDNPTLMQHFEITCLTTWPCVVGGCERDYDASCPLEWLQTSNGLCRGPTWYQETTECPGVLDTRSYSRSEKRSFSVKCNADFPCKDRKHCARIDFSSRCPVGWTDKGDGSSCLAPPDYNGPCDNVQDLKDISEDNKQDLMRKCNFEWPCVGEWNSPIAMEYRLRKSKKQAQL